jgi:hypothetical protein
MGEKFSRDQNKSDNSEGELHSLSPQAPKHAGKNEFCGIPYFPERVFL